MIGKFLAVLFTGSMLISLVSCWQRDQIRSDINFEPQIQAEPHQLVSDEDGFSVTFEGVEYLIEPRYDYRLHGLVVSMREHDGDRMLHQRWGDHLNIADLCVVWGSNLSEDLDRFEFRNGQFTCFYQTSDGAAWQRFDPSAISNNNILTDDTWLREQIADLRIGNQISLRGKLARYSHSSGFVRDTSTVRTDTGNGACETIYLESLTVLKQGNAGWHTAFSTSLIVALVCAALWVAGVMQGRIH
jgi:hypothetical protein